jgi:Mn-dependent DtxR family transcriptional regulator
MDADPGDSHFRPLGAPSRKQGPFLAFIHYYTKLNGCPPAEADLARYLEIMPPAAYQMVIAREQHGLIELVPGPARSIRLLPAGKDLPDLV